MKCARALAILFSFSFFATAPGCSKEECEDTNSCLPADQCYDAPNLLRYPLQSRSYVVSRSTVGLDECALGRRNGDWNGISVELVTSDETLGFSLRASNGIELGSGSRHAEPYCNAGSVANRNVQGGVGACAFVSAFDTQVRLLPDGALYLSIVETHSSLSAGCPSSTANTCVIVFDAWLQ